MKVLVTGGAGYIGSAVVKQLLISGHDPFVIDSLERGRRDNVPNAPLFIGHIGDNDFVNEVIDAHGPMDACIHLAAYAYVGESVQNPVKYVKNNLLAGTRLLHTLLDNGVKRIVFASSCAVYGEPVTVPIPEYHRRNPCNPYGYTKMMFEDLLEMYSRSVEDFRYVALRFFNVSGSWIDHGTTIMEKHVPETHLIPLLVVAALCGNEFTIYGDDFDTDDGTAVRDYVHVQNIAQAHVMALEGMCSGSLPPPVDHVFNLGTGNPHSVRECIKVVEKITGCTIKIKVAGRRGGDPAILSADHHKAKAQLGWTAMRDLEDIVASITETYDAEA